MSARDELRRYVRLLADSWTPRETTDERVEKLYAKVRAEVLHEAAAALEADMERFFSVFPDEPRNSPYALGHKDASDEVRRMAGDAS